MKISSSSSKFLAQWKYVEVARYVNSLGRVIREKKDDLPVFYSFEDIDFYREYNSNTGLYTSIWRYDKPDIESAVRLGSLYFDIDSDDIEESYKECILLYDFLKSKIPASAVLVYFTGKKGFHIECEAVTLGINPSNNLPNIFRWIATKVKDQLNLNNLDFSVYDARRMWRLEGSKHQDTGLYKNLIPDNILYDSIEVVKEYCKNRQLNDVADQQFNAGANEWFREYIYDL